MTKLLPLALLAALGACGGSDSGPGGVTANEARALDEAAEMLEQRRLPDAVLRAPAPPAEAAPAEAANPVSAPAR